MPDRIPSHLDQLIESAKPLTPLALAFLAVCARFMMLPRGHSVFTFLRGLFVAAFVGLTVNSAALGYGLDENWRAVVVAVTAFLADDLLRGLIVVGRQLKEDPFAVWDRVFRRK